MPPHERDERRRNGRNARRLPPGVPAVPAVAEYYVTSEYWPAESLARRAALLAVQGRSRGVMRRHAISGSRAFTCLVVSAHAGTQRRFHVVPGCMRNDRRCQ